MVDYDDVLTHFLEAWVIWLNRKHNLNVKMEDIREWDLDNFYPTLTHEQIMEPVQGSEFFRSVRPRVDAMYYLEKLKSENIDIYVVTATHYSTIKTKFDFLKIYYPFITWDKVIVTENKQMIKGDILVDDGIHNLIGGNYFKILFTAPHNVDFDAEAHGMVRAGSWKDVYETIHKYIEEVERI